MAWEWSEHRHKLLVSEKLTVYHQEMGQLSYAEMFGPSVIWHPIRFPDYAAARKWIQSGDMATIQREMNALQVGFVNEMVSIRQIGLGKKP